ncbi:enoyl-CoA hydratase-related protein [Roseisolibacter sp. H3M3-2]|uniref:enoyl-CoA hydratase-related protein n=1 Tax=Roseisolibacter sp. H3M3-2 TaxID=3031323 RepID=UPI0023DA3E0F|nr:enoyl-CoA hydratase-related protein [Roseisolibacter sp. H3M3-2]MDF1503909.1 enoyl-CoA hydratase-related protein [Roseisolibacter sp. H3M3-2]
MLFQTLTLDVADRVAVLTVNRPDKLNALADLVIRELGQAMDDLRGRDEVGAVILTGAGRAFIAGADISEIGKADALDAKRRSRLGQEVFRKFETSPKPTIAAVNGFALGGGCELAMACHVRLASEHAKFGQPEVKLGLVPGYAGTQRLPRLVGKGRALQLLLTGEIIDAQEAYRIGLANAVVLAAELMDRARAMAGAMLANAPVALALCIEAVNAGYDLPFEEAQQYESNAFGLAAATEDKREGTAAFLEKRTPAFRGR